MDTRSDLYSFGCTLYEMLVGHVPFAGNAKVAMVKHLTEDAEPVREIDPTISEGFAAIVTRLMEKSQDDRYTTPRDLTTALIALEKQQQEAPAVAASASPTNRRRRRR